MKKIISALLALALAASLCACGNTDANGTEDTTTSAQTTETTKTTETTETPIVETESEEEKARKATQARYEKAKEYLTKYLEDGSFRDDDWMYYRGSEALAYLYAEFEALGDYEDSAEIFARFTVLPDMLTSISEVTTDHLGNVTDGAYVYTYDAKGTQREKAPILTFLGINSWRYYVGYGGYQDYQYEYDDEDRISCIKLITLSGTVEAIVTPEYDESGNIVKATAQTNTDTYTSTWTYDGEDRLIAADKYRVDWGTPVVWTLYSYTYSYDADGNLAEEKYSYTDRWDQTYNCTVIYDQNGDVKKKDDGHWIYEYEYEYDANGYIVMKKESENQTVTQYFYTNDENGRPISAELIETEDGKNAYASQILTYNYETLYFYDAE
jgi:YD repeat-containing protein